MTAAATSTRVAAAAPTVDARPTAAAAANRVGAGAL